MKKKFSELAANYAGLAVSVLSLCGFVSAIAFIDDAKAAVSEHPGSVALLSAPSFLAGAAVSRSVMVTSRRARKRAKVERLSRCFTAMSARRKKMVATALDKGEVRAWSLDEDATALCAMGIFGTPPYASYTGETPFSLQPSVAAEIAAHRKEWLGI